MNKKSKEKISWLSSNAGSSAVEFSLVFIPFFMAMLFLAELCRIVFISSALDFILTESGYRASLRSPGSDCNAFFTKALNERLDVWPLFTKKITLGLSILYCDDVTALVDNSKRCSSTNATGKPLALYNVSVNYQPLFFTFPPSVIESRLNRKVAFVQEFQRGDL